MSKLFIAEKPKMGRAIAEALGSGLKSGVGCVQVGNDYVTWCVGHLLELANPEDYNPEFIKWRMDLLPIIPETWKLQISGDKGKQVKIIKDLLQNVDEVVNAGDPGREGQLIIDELLLFLKNKKPVQRLLLNSLDKKSIKTALGNLQDNKKFLNTYEAGVGRQRADWLIGMNMTRAYTLIGQGAGGKGVLSVGRVQSPTLAMVVRRDLEIESFVPKDYWTIVGEFQTAKNEVFAAKWLPNQKQKEQPWLEETKILEEKKANEICQKVNGQPGVIRDYEQKRVQEAPPLPFELSDMQIHCNAKWGYSAQDVLETCQKLYENGFLSYPRTDCPYLPENQFSEAAEIIKAIGAQSELNGVAGKSNLSLKSAAWDDSKLGEHHGLIPTREVASFVSDMEKNIYMTSAKRYIAQFYPDAEIDKTKIVVVVHEEEFTAQGSIVAFSGWKEVFGYEPPVPKQKKKAKKNDDDSTEAEDEDDGTELPSLVQGEKVLCQKTNLEKKQTTPPSRFTQGSLLEAMKKAYLLVSDPEMRKRLKESKGIGTSATRANIIETLIKRALLLSQGKKVISSDSGRGLINMLPDKLVDPGLTAVWEMALDSVAKGKLPFNQFYDKQTAWLNKLIENAKLGYKPIAQRPAPQSSGKTCSVCKKGQMVLRVVKNGPKAGNKFWGCNNFPHCKNIEQHDGT